MRNKCAAGFTLVEMIVAMVIIGVGLAGVLTAFQQATRSSADPLVQKQMLSVAEEMLEEILLKPYAAGPGSISGCNRSLADDISDYAGYDQAVCDIDGTPVNGLAGYAVRVKLSDVTLATVPAKKIEVEVSRGETLTLVGWRTNYAAP